jgi:aconitate hydratase
MIRTIKKKVYLEKGKLINENNMFLTAEQKERATKGSMAYKILSAHNIAINEDNLKIKFDAITSHDITYVGIVQTAKASGLKEFPISYTLTNCHNSLCAVGGTINEDDHVFGLSAAKKYGGNYVPAHIAVIHQYMREMEAKCGRMILGSDSHTRYGALGTMAIGEGGPELVKQILNKTYDVKRPEIICVYLKGRIKKGVGPQDVAIALVGKVFKDGFVKNKVLEFVGPAIRNLSMDFRNGIDVMTTETTCLSSIWETDEKTLEYYKIHGRENDYKKMQPDDITLYDGAVVINLSDIEPMIALPFHPSNAYTIRELLANPYEILKTVEQQGQKLLGENGQFKLTDKIVNGKIMVNQGIIAGCAGGMYENIAEAYEILKDKNTGVDEFSLSIYPSSQPVYKALVDNGYIGGLLSSGVVVKTAFCGPCFGAGDVPANNGLSIRHTTRNFENREGSKTGNGQLAAVALMDARSIAATAANGGILTPATDFVYNTKIKKYKFDKSIYENRVYKGVSKPQKETELKYGPNIADWPHMIPMGKNILLKAASVLTDPVTTTDELIPSGETSSYRSNPMKLAEFTLSRKDPAYVSRAKAIKVDEDIRRKEGNFADNLANELKLLNVDINNTIYGSVVIAIKPGDGSAREQAASCQRVLGGIANIATEYATKRYRSNLINWGMIPLLAKKNNFNVGDYIYIENIYDIIKEGKSEFKAKVLSNGHIKEITLYIDSLTEDEKQIILKGCLINFYAK